MAALWMVAVVVAASPVRGVDGGLPFEQVKDLIEWRSPEINACLAGAAKRASVRYRFIVGVDGQVTQIAFLDSQKVESPRVTCVGTALEKWRFPAADGGTVVEWDFAASSFDAGIPTEPEDLAPEHVAARWVDDASRCYDAIGPNEKREGRLGLELIVTRAGAVAEQSTTEVSAAIAAVSPCLASKARSWSFPAATGARRIRTWWVFATTELRTKGHFIPSAPAKEIVAWQPTLNASGGTGGGLPRTVILSEIRKATPRVRACYERGLEARSSLEGRVTVAFRIGPDGRVNKQSVTEDELDHAPTTDCILKVVGRLEFPPPTGGGNVNVTFPWVLKPVAADDE